MINKKDLIARMAEIGETTKVEAEKRYDVFMDSIYSFLEAGESIQVQGDFTFKVKEVKERTFDNPKDRTQKVVVPAHLKVTAKLGKNFQDAVNAE